MDEERVSQFAAVTGASPAIATQYLNLAENHIEQAVELYFANDGADLGQPTNISSGSVTTSQAPGYLPATTDEREVVQLDSDPEDPNYADDSDVQVIDHSQTQETINGKSSSSSVPVHAPSKLTDDDEAIARRMQEELYGARDEASGNQGTEQLDEHGYRAPMARTTETLVGPDTLDPTNAEEMRTAVMQQMAARRDPSRRGRHGIFNQAMEPSIWNDANTQSNGRRESLAQATGGASESSTKSNLLAEMYRPPFELMSRLPWDAARQQGREGEKWILVNIQDPSIFDCQVLNRDIWKNAGVMETVKENFIFMQFSKDDPKANQYMQYYFQNKENADAYPHIAIVDPRTGEQVKVWSGPPAPKAMDFLMQLHEFLDRYSLKVSAKNPVAKRKPEMNKEKQIDQMTEEQMMEMAMQASLAGEAKNKASDPDDLTRSVDDLAGKKVDVDRTNSNSPHPNGSSTTAQSLFQSISTSHPHNEPVTNTAVSTRIQFRHPGGRVVRRFLLTESVRRIYEWLKATPLEGRESAGFELIFMGKNLIESLEDTIEQAGLKNGTVMVEFVDND